MQLFIFKLKHELEYYNELQCNYICHVNNFKIYSEYRIVIMADIKLKSGYV